MASDNTAPKRYLFILQADGDARALLPCPSCHRVMAADDAHLRWNVWHRNVRPDAVEVAQASHTVAAADGGRTVALECAVCNHSRGRSAWDVPAGVPTARAGKRAAYREAAGIIKTSAATLTY